MVHDGDACKLSAQLMLPEIGGIGSQNNSSYEPRHCGS